MAYSSSIVPVAIYPGDSETVWNAESPATAASSRQVALGDAYGRGDAGLSVEIVFSGAPGAFQIDLQTADTDTDAAYVTYAVGGSFTSVNANQYVRGDFMPLPGRFARLNMQNDPANPVTVTARLTRV